MSIRFIFLTLLLCLITTASYGQLQYPFLAEVTADRVNVRAGQNANFEKLSTLDKGDQVVVLQKSFSWYKIKLDKSSKSYISEDFVKLIGNGKGEITASRVNVRAGKGINFSILGQLRAGDSVKIIEHADGWFKIEPVAESTGWVSEKFLKFKSQKIVSESKAKKQKPAKVLAKEVKQSPPKKQSKKIQSVKASQKVEKPSVTQPQKKPPVKAKAQKWKGRLKLSSKKTSEDFPYILVVDGKSYSLLKCPKHILSEFLDYYVTIEGFLKSGKSKSDKPSILVSKIQRIL